jgi:hypothetical protein
MLRTSRKTWISYHNFFETNAESESLHFISKGRLPRVTNCCKFNQQCLSSNYRKSMKNELRTSRHRHNIRASIKSSDLLAQLIG